MLELNEKQIRRFWLRSHHLDRRYGQGELIKIAGACGLQNTPPGAWETALFHRVPGCRLPELETLLYTKRSLLQAWSFRGAPVVFPTGESDVFLTALIPEGDEPWIYTRGISLALDLLQMTMGELLERLRQAIPLMDHRVIEGKTALDQTLAEAMLPLLPAGKRELWNRPSMYGSPERQTVGGAVVSFLLRPCAFCGLVVFGERRGVSPAFTSYRSWTGGPLQARPDAVQRLVRKYLHCYGPATPDSFESWLGCSGQQARRMWESVAGETEPVTACGRQALILSADREALLSADPPQRELLLLGGHDPYLDQRRRDLLLGDRSLQRQVWRTVGNPGAVLRDGEIVGIWGSKKKGRGIEVRVTLWDGTSHDRRRIFELAEEYAAFRRQELLRVEDGAV